MLLIWKFQIKGLISSQYKHRGASFRCIKYKSNVCKGLICSHLKTAVLHFLLVQTK